MAKEKSTVELQDKKAQLIKRKDEILASAKTEKRMLNDTENDEVRQIQLDLVDTNVELAAQEARGAAETRKHEVKKDFSLRKALLDMAEGRAHSEDTEKMHKVGQEFHRSAGQSAGGLCIPIEARDSFTATGAAGTGSDMIETVFMDILAPLRDRMVLATAGANVLTGLVGNIDIPSYSGATANWAKENDKAKDGGGKFSHKTMKPKRLTSTLTISKQLLAQDSLGVERMIRQDLVNAIASSLEAAILGNHKHGDEMPDGIFTGFNDAAIDFGWDAIVDLETAIDSNNALVNGAYVMHTALRGAAKKTAKKSEGVLGFILEPDGTLNEYKALRTNAVAKKGEEYGIAFGNWADLLIGQWGALDITVDPYTRAKEAAIEITINSYWDAAARRDESFAKKYMKIGKAAPAPAK